jgi:hypothetical protein
MIRTFYLTILLAAAAIALLYLWLRDPSKQNRSAFWPAQKDVPSQKNIATPASRIDVPPAPIPDVPGAKLTQQDKEKLGKIITVFSAPIEFFGRIQDTRGNPIPAARVHYSAANNYFGESSKYEGLSDAEGFFSIKGIKGAGLYVDVYKEGYDGTKLSGASFGYGMPSGKTPPTQANPAIFVLRKKAATEPLVVVTSRQYEVSKTGTPIRIDLQSGRQGVAGNDPLTVQTWVNDERKDAKGRFSWKYRIEVPGGGLTERKDEMDFQAPADGYRPSDEIDMLADRADWNTSASREFFIKLADGKYAHVKIEVMVGGRFNFVVLESYLNPSGSPNLEHDSAKEIKPNGS